MKSYTSILLIILLITSCKETIQSSNVEVEATEVLSKSEPTKSKLISNSTFLCKINGEDWSYTKASGIVSRHKKTKKRTAITTFTKQLDKGKETVQLTYDGDTNQLEQVGVHLKVPKTDGKKMTAMYIYHPNTMKFHPKAKISGTIDLSNSSNASGNAEVIDLDIRFDKENIKNDTDTNITVKGINFRGIGYSEAGKQFGSKGTAVSN